VTKVAVSLNICGYNCPNFQNVEKYGDILQQQQKSKGYP